MCSNVNKCLEIVSFSEERLSNNLEFGFVTTHGLWDGL